MPLFLRLRRGLSHEKSHDRVIVECQACGHQLTEPFFSSEQIPVSSCTLSESRSAASGFARGDMELAVCHRCGFIQNRLFDRGLVDYTLPYEESQSFSPRFVAFQDQLISRLVRDHGLEGKTILEIGSGKGAFLETICRVAGAKGIGIDPAGDSSRLTTDVDLTLIREHFDESKTHLTGDLICCRHTLEHIQTVGNFVRNVADSIQRTSGSVAFFEIPDTERILDEGAFWDVYYEHCSYFTSGSVGHLFRSKGLTITRLERAFDDQYLLLEAQKGSPLDSPDPGVVEQTVAKCRDFAEVVGREVERWRELVAGAAARGHTVVVWGAGSKAVGFLSALGLDEAIGAVVDVNPFKQSSFLPGSAHEIVAPDRLQEINPDLVVVMNPVYEGEIGEMLAGFGLHPRLASLGVLR